MLPTTSTDQTMLAKPSTKRVLIIGDSHSRNMTESIKKTHPKMEVMLSTMPSSLDQIKAFFMSHKLSEALYFNPDWIIVHGGHNDVAKHKFFNTDPMFAGSVAHDQVKFAMKLKSLFPKSSIMCSSLFPRKPTHTSSLSEENTIAYNWIAKRYGLRLRSLAEEQNIRCSLNMVLWKQVSKAKENSSLISPDGLHLTKVAKIKIGMEWVNTFLQPIVAKPPVKLRQKGATPASSGTCTTVPKTSARRRPKDVIPASK